MVRFRGGFHPMIAALALRTTAIFLLFFGGIALAIYGHLALGIAIHVALVGFLLAGTLNPSSRLFGPVITSCEKGIWITLDDGPDPVDTPAILDIFDRHDAKATFFVIGKKAERHPELIREIHRRGHQIGNHSWSHPHAFFWCLGPLRTYREIAKCQETIKGIIGVAPTVFRAPVGHYNVFVHPILKHFGLKLIGWSSRGYDGVSASLENVTGRIRKSAGEGGIILAHEATPIASEVVESIIRLAQEKGWSCIIPDDTRESGNC